MFILFWKILLIFLMLISLSVFISLIVLFNLKYSSQFVFIGFFYYFWIFIVIKIWLFEKWSFHNVFKLETWRLFIFSLLEITVNKSSVNLEVFLWIMIFLFETYLFIIKKWSKNWTISFRIKSHIMIEINFT